MHNSAKNSFALNRTLNCFQHDRSLFKNYFEPCYGQTERPLKTRSAEHRKAVSRFDHNSNVAAYVHQSNHNMDFEKVEVVALEVNYHERLFLGAWKIQMLGTITSKSRKHINALHEHKSFKSNVSGHARKNRATFLRFFHY